MNLLLSLELGKNEIALDYRRHIISFLKDAVQSLDKKYFEDIFGTKTQKPYTFSVKFSVKHFNKKLIELNNNKIEIELSTSDVFVGAIFSEALMQKDKVLFKKNDFEATLISFKMKTIKRAKENKVMIKFESPLVVQSHEYNKDWFFGFQSDGFEEQLKMVVENQLKALNSNCNPSIRLTPVNAKKTVVRFYEKQIESSIGTYCLEADPDLINLLLLSGIGSKRSSGFGKFNIIT